MNSCVLMAEIIKDPELRFTSDNQTPIAEMLVQFPGQREDESPTTLKVVGWGNLAQELKNSFRRGDRVIIEGRLGMNTVDRPEGFKEKRAELTVSRLYKLGADAEFSSPVVESTAPSNVVPMARNSAKRAKETEVETHGWHTADSAVEPVATSTKTYSAPSAEPDLDDIPF